jgi:hypothetical protein
MTETRVYRYGLLKPHAESAHAVMGEIHAAHQHRNRLIEIERTRRIALAALGEEVRVAKDALEPPPPPDEKPAARKARLKKVRLSPAEAGAFDAKKAAIQAAADAANKAAYAESAVHWPTKNIIRESVRQSKGVEPPRFVRWHEATHRLGMQIQLTRPLSAEDLLVKQDHRLAIVGEGRHRVLRMEIGRARTVVSWPLVFHRPLPAGAQVKAAAVCWRPTPTGRNEWSVNITLRLPDAPAVEGPDERAEMVGVDVGWRKRKDDKMRVAYWVGSDGREGKVLLPTAILERLKKAESLRSIRDKVADEAREGVLEELRRLAPSELIVNVHAWRAPGRYRRLQAELRKLGIETPQLDAWLRRDRHLHQYEYGTRVKALGHRLDLYRNVAADLKLFYKRVVVENFDKREVAKVKEAKGDPSKVMPRPVRRARVHAATSLLVQALKNVYGPNFVECPCAYTTMTCHACSHVEPVGAQLLHTCSACGLTWDQDANAARNLLRLAATPAPNQPSPPKEAAWTRRKKAKAEKEAALTVG